MPACAWRIQGQHTLNQQSRGSHATPPRDLLCFPLRGAEILAAEQRGAGHEGNGDGSGAEGLGEGSVLPDALAVGPPDEVLNVQSRQAHPRTKHLFAGHSL